MPQTQRSSSHPSLRRKLLYAFITVVLLLGGAEVILRLSFPFIRRATLPQGMIRAHLEKGAMRYDPDYFWFWNEGSPSHRSPKTTGRRCKNNDSCINAYGFRRSKPMSRRKPPGIIRAMSFGDSQTHGAGVVASNAYSAVAEQELGERWEVINAAVSGFRSLNVYRYIQRHIEQYQPDVLIIDCMVYDSQRDNGTISIPPDHVHSFRKFFWSSRLYYALRFIREKSRVDRPHWLDKDPGHRPDRLDEFGNHDLILKWGRKRNIKVVFMSYPVMDRDRLRCMTKNAELPPGAPIVPACEVLSKSGHKVQDLFLDNNHMTALGNRIVGQALAKTLKSLEPQLKR